MRPSLADPFAPRFPGGRAEALRRLAAIDPPRYGRTRNHLEGAVTQLSPYIRHGVLTLAEVRDAVFTWLDDAGLGSPPGRRIEGQRIAGKLINELGWRDYWQRLWRRLGDGVWQDLEPLKTGHPPEAYAPELPPDLTAARTGLACIDGFAAGLMGTGWLHNHARMWLAAYVVHWRRVSWQAGARWFLHHLLDGDPASNNLSWQWVASSFSSKPYIFNRDNLERFSSGRHCRQCPAAGHCPFDASYESLQAQLFRAETAASAPTADTPHPSLRAPQEEAIAARSPTVPPRPQRPVLWIHEEGLGPSNPALRAHPDQPALFVLEATGAAGTGVSLSDQRLRFLESCAEALPLDRRRGAVAEELLNIARAHDADAIVTSRAVDPRLIAIAASLQGLQDAVAPTHRIPLIELEPDPFVVLEEPVDLRRFSRYWRRAESRVWALWSQQGA